MIDRVGICGFLGLIFLGLAGCRLGLIQVDSKAQGVESLFTFSQNCHTIYGGKLGSIEGFAFIDVAVAEDGQLKQTWYIAANIENTIKFRALF